MADVQALADQFRARFEAGEDPDPREFVQRADEGSRQELASLIDRYLMTAPRRSWDPATYEMSGAKAAVDRVYESLDGVSGSWPELLPRLRNAARVKRSELVAQLAEALGVGTGAPQIEKVGGYYHRMEHGLLPAEGVSGRVIEALADIVGASAETIRRAGGGTKAGGGQPSPAFARLATDERWMASAPVANEAFELADADVGGGPAERDEIDRLFTEG